MKKGQFSIKFLLWCVIALLVLLILILIFQKPLGLDRPIREKFSVSLSSCHNETNEGFEGCITGCNLHYKLSQECWNDCSEIYTEEVCSSKPVDEIHISDRCAGIHASPTCVELSRYWLGNRVSDGTCQCVNNIGSCVQEKGGSYY